jgi:hypothetical protein
LSHSVEFQYRQRPFEVRITDDGGVELYLDGVMRKRREPGEREPRYVWTNVELEWEEHHYIEARYWASSGQLVVTVNGEPLLDERMPGHGT